MLSGLSFFVKMRPIGKVIGEFDFVGFAVGSLIIAYVLLKSKR